MHAIRQHEFGPAESLLYEKVDDPEPGPGQVRIAVRAAGVHLLDTSIRRGEAGGPFPPPALPMTPGREVAGVVDALGPGVDGAWLGRRAVAHLGQASGGYAELAVRDVEAIHRVPDGLSDAEAVAMIGTGRTALAVLEVAELRPTDLVVVTGAAGGLGSLLVQAGQNAGVDVLGLAGGPDKVAHVHRQGATWAIDYRAPGWEEQARAAVDGRDVTVVLDGVGGEVGAVALDLLAPGGRLVLFGWSSGAPVPLTAGTIVGKGIRVDGAIGARVLQRPGGLRGLEEAALAAAASGRLKPLVNPTFPLAEAAEAHRALESRATYGKVVLVP